MKKANSIDIREFSSNIEVFASRDDDNGNWEGSGRILSITCDADMIPSSSCIPTIHDLHAQANGYLTIAQCREIKERIYDHCYSWFNFKK